MDSGGDGSGGCSVPGPKVSAGGLLCIVKGNGNLGQVWCTTEEAASVASIRKKGSYTATGWAGHNAASELLKDATSHEYKLL